MRPNKSECHLEKRSNRPLEELPKRDLWRSVRVRPEGTLLYLQSTVTPRWGLNVGWMHFPPDESGGYRHDAPFGAKTKTKSDSLFIIVGLCIRDFFLAFALKPSLWPSQEKGQRESLIMGIVRWDGERREGGAVCEINDHSHASCRLCTGP